MILKAQKRVTIDQCQRFIYGQKISQIYTIAMKLSQKSPIFTDDSSQEFTATLRRIQDSSTYGVFCERVYGRNLRQFNAVDEEQLQKLLLLLNINESHSLLDLGCGGGFISEYISDLTGANVTGIDFSEDIIRSAQNRTYSKRDRLNFLTADLNAIPQAIGKFNFILSIDTLYFVDDLAECIKSIKSHLLPGGQFAAFFSFKKQQNDSESSLNPDLSKLGRALAAEGFNIHTIDFSTNEKAIWENAKKFAESLRESFIAEGHFEIYQERIWESERHLKSTNDGQSARFLYLTESLVVSKDSMSGE